MIIYYFYFLFSKDESCASKKHRKIPVGEKQYWRRVERIFNHYLEYNYIMRSTLLTRVLKNFRN